LPKGFSRGPRDFSFSGKTGFRPDAFFPDFVIPGKDRSYTGIKNKRADFHGEPEKRIVEKDGEKAPGNDAPARKNRRPNARS
jgi:hypothetical protein